MSAIIPYHFQPTIHLQFATPWSIFTPTVFRMMQRRYVEAFFESGELLISSFDRFTAHPDEERKDAEHWKMVYAWCEMDEPGKGQMLSSWLQGDKNAYMLCGTVCNPTEGDDLFAAFGADAAIQIFNTTEFAACIARHIPGVRFGSEGYCTYTDQGVRVNIPKDEIERYTKMPKDKNPDLNEFASLMFNAAGLTVYFQKSSKFRHQLEYRWLWQTFNRADSQIVIRVPEARQFCMPWFQSS